MPPRRQKSSRSKVAVPAASGMLDQTFRLHCQIRHPNLGFWARGEHEADHRLHGDSLDHIHQGSEAQQGADETTEDQEEVDNA